MIAVVDSSLNFKDEVVRAARNKTKEVAMRQLIAIRGVADKDTSLLKKLRRTEKGVVSVTNDVIANAVKWSAKRPKLTSVSNRNTQTHNAHSHRTNTASTHTVYAQTEYTSLLIWYAHNITAFRQSI